MRALKCIREQRGLSQEELARLVNVERSAVAKWESTDGYPRGETLIALADALGISIDCLCGRESPQEPPSAAAS